VHAAGNSTAAALSLNRPPPALKPTAQCMTHTERVDLLPEMLRPAQGTKACCEVAGQLLPCHRTNLWTCRRGPKRAVPCSKRSVRNCSGPQQLRGSPRGAAWTLWTALQNWQCFLSSCYLEPLPSTAELWNLTRNDWAQKIDSIPTTLCTSLTDCRYLTGLLQLLFEVHLITTPPPALRDCSRSLLKIGRISSP